MNIDVLTTTSISSGLAFLISLIIFILYLKFQFIKSSLYWSLGYLFNSLGFAVYYMAMHYDISIVILISNTLVILGNCFGLHGLWLFKEKKTNWVVLWGLGLSMVLLTFIFVYIYPSVLYRRICFSGILLVCSCISIKELVFKVPAGLKFAYYLNATFFSLYGLGMAFRIILAIYNLKVAENFSLIIFLYSHVSIAFGCILMVNYRISEELKKAYSSKDLIYSIVAHDLRSAMGNIKNFSTLIEQRVLTPEKQEYFINQISKLGNVTTSILENLLNWSQSQTGELEYNPEMIDIGKITDNTIELLHVIAEQKKIRILNCIQDGAFAYADANMVEIVIRNIIANAIKFTNPGGNIIIEAESIDNKIIISIQDNGIGINENNLKKIFEFNSYTKTYGTNHEPGSGLGLRICYNFIQRNKGSIRFESKLGNGTSVFITLPNLW